MNSDERLAFVALIEHVLNVHAQPIEVRARTYLGQERSQQPQHKLNAECPGNDEKSKIHATSGLKPNSYRANWDKVSQIL
eukprot:CAMPEP_0204156440 /NCGR_PEP_ID=MMETSP0361-20130328/30432_1 /ASSEMBLY_ACC=CAM_ASM_000343 /TAXON_ID=268821 /ORGANISM="Scrippsiella Hangoei, Strain SHTV-5" /LENGTH=79 /DNA_ID=CAMNT_0051112063 /DNA_START=118 /DNA_END=354 /DNA_ORIENTATION=-